ncbi:hypothetical protein EW146_g8992 [Bondarzewia mesenterica]|uniref:Uncharacterized protein n=1 Tax=Bondarzewia mesenterica TaxID=1095465 RepID=A0A4S4LFB1_9AGAM|nr:hypothetical protein EW146_g8992 [Bondarzewia mesenterica]
MMELRDRIIIAFRHASSRTACPNCLARLRRVHGRCAARSLSFRLAAQRPVTWTQPEDVHGHLGAEYQPVGVVKDTGLGELAFSKRDAMSYVVIHGRFFRPSQDVHAQIQPVEHCVGTRDGRFDSRGAARWRATPSFAYDNESGEVMFDTANAQKLRSRRSVILTMFVHQDPC